MNKLILFDLNGTIIYRSKNSKKVYIRSHLEEFKEFPLIGIYSSMPFRNIVKIIPKLPINISVVFDRSFTSPDTERFKTIRNLDLIMKSEFIKNHGIKKENIIIIDNEPRKVRYCKENAIIIPEFDVKNKDDIELIKLKNNLKGTFTI